MARTGELSSALRMNDIFRTWMAEIVGHGLFSEEEVEALTQRVTEREVRGKPTPYIRCLIRDKDVQLKREEGIRQLWLARIMGKYGYPKGRISVEYPVTFGRDTSKRADIVIFDADRSEERRVGKE